MISSAWSTSHLYITTNFVPPMKQPSMTGTQPVTWNSGTIRMNAGGCVVGSPGWRSRSTAPRQANAISACTTAPWVLTAPFGRPVVPDV